MLYFNIYTNVYFYMVQNRILFSNEIIFSSHITNKPGLGAALFSFLL